MIKKRFEALDAFRGLCALSVVVFHMHWIESITELDFFSGALVFVEFFFVLSGFVLAHGYGFKRELDFKSFMKSRFFRLYPLHFAMFIFAFSFQCIKFFAYDYGGITFGSEPFSGNFAFSEIIPNLMLIQSWTPYTEHLSYNGPSWSISIEFYMYAILFMSILFFKSHKVISWLMISTISYILLFSGSDVLLNTVLRGLSCFFGGAVAYLVYTKISDLRPTYVLGSLVETILIVSVIFSVQSNIQNKGALCSILFILTVLFFAFESGIVSNALKNKPFQYLGMLSYSIYMVHGIILLYLGALFKVLEKVLNVKIRVMTDTVEYTTLGNAFINNIAVFTIVVLVVFISHFTYKYIEVKGQQLNGICSNKLKSEIVR
ncbi:acyltransferase family protein [Agarivorans sp. Z349TD_8]|uniref:acyltransferase family protein n=1 Tax=Agarivorans sp. Z349TD_8 TaxID=3421434 RepID=UPI003D7C8333